jgi:hypothetical protein
MNTPGICPGEPEVQLARMVIDLLGELMQALLPILCKDVGFWVSTLVSSSFWISHGIMAIKVHYTYDEIPKDNPRAYFLY